MYCRGIMSPQGYQCQGNAFTFKSVEHSVWKLLHFFICCDIRTHIWFVWFIGIAYHIQLLVAFQLNVKVDPYCRFGGDRSHCNQLHTDVMELNLAKMKVVKQMFVCWGRLVIYCVCCACIVDSLYMCRPQTMSPECRDQMSWSQRRNQWRSKDFASLNFRSLF